MVKVKWVLLHSRTVTCLGRVELGAAGKVGSWG